jgi:sigma-E factor negative regulatory protein RseA
MTEALREAASAFMDGESSELEYRRVLRDVADDGTRTWLVRQYAVRAVLRDRVERVCPTPVQDAVLAALAREPELSGRSQVTPAVASGLPGWLKPVAGFAVAASVCAAVVLGSGVLSNGSPAGSVEMAERGAAPLPALGTSAVTRVGGSGQLMTVGFGPATARTALGDSAQSNAAAAERLRYYLVQHADRASINVSQGLMPLARVSDESRSESF